MTEPLPCISRNWCPMEHILGNRNLSVLGQTHTYWYLKLSLVLETESSTSWKWASLSKRFWFRSGFGHVLCIPDTWQMITPWPLSGLGHWSFIPQLSSCRFSPVSLCLSCCWPTLTENKCFPLLVLSLCIIILILDSIKHLK